jgi:hypothetical protein
VAVPHSPSQKRIGSSSSGSAERHTQHWPVLSYSEELSVGPAEEEEEEMGTEFLVEW